MNAVQRLPPELILRIITHAAEDCGTVVVNTNGDDEEGHWLQGHRRIPALLALSHVNRAWSIAGGMHPLWRHPQHFFQRVYDPALSPHMRSYEVYQRSLNMMSWMDLHLHHATRRSSLVELTSGFMLLPVPEHWRFLEPCLNPILVPTHVSPRLLVELLQAKSSNQLPRWRQLRLVGFELLERTDVLIEMDVQQQLVQIRTLLQQLEHDAGFDLKYM